MVGMIITKHRRAIERMYTDRCTVSRPTKSKDPVTKETTFSPLPVYADQACRISQKALAQNDQTEAQNKIRYETKLFIAPELAIKQGDEIAVTRGDVTRTYQAGEPFLYSTHQEVSLQRRDEA